VLPPVLFTPGPVVLDGATLRDGAEPMIYHRTPEFSACVRHCEELLKAALGAHGEERIAIITGSGTAAMEACVLNLFAAGERVLVVNGGDFGQRFVEIAALHDLHVTEIKLAPGQSLTASHLAPHRRGGFRGLLINHHETSTGTLYDLSLVASFCRDEALLLIVDAIGSFLADPLSMSELGLDALIVSSQKALALPPGLSFVALSARAQACVQSVPVRSFYLDLKRYLADATRGQTPFTPAVGLVRQLERRLERLHGGGVAAQIEAVRTRALDFRRKLSGLPFDLLTSTPSNAVTPLVPRGVAPARYVSALAAQGLFVCPNGGELRDRIFRVGHLGDLSSEDNTRLVDALRAIGQHYGLLGTSEE